MSNPQMPSAEITIKMNGTMSFTHTYKGSPALLIPMIGALDFAKDWMKGEVKNAGVKHEPLCAEQKPNSLEIEVTRDVAMAHYWQAMEKMRERLLAMDKAPEEQLFHIDPSLLKSL